MALATNSFEEGATALVAQTYELSLQLPFNGEDEFTFICNTEVEEAFNEEIITTYTLCGEGAASNKPGGQDYEVAFEIDQVKGDEELSQWVYRVKHDQNSRVNIPVRIDNTLMNTRTEFTGVIILDTAGGAAEETAMISGTIKPYSGSITVTTIEEETTPTEVPALATATASDIADVTANVNYNVVMNDDTNLRIIVFPGTTEPTGSEVGSVNLSADASDILALTGLTAETDYVVMVESDLITTAELLTQFTTIATV